MTDAAAPDANPRGLMTVETVIVAFVVALFSVVSTAVVTLKIKFAPDAATAARELRKLGFVAFEWGFNVGNVVLLFYAALNAWPLTKSLVLMMILQGLTVVLFMVSSVAQRMATVQVAHAGATETLAGQLERTLDALEHATRMQIEVTHALDEHTRQLTKAVLTHMDVIGQLAHDLGATADLQRDLAEARKRVADIPVPIFRQVPAIAATKRPPASSAQST